MHAFPLVKHPCSDFVPALELLPFLFSFVSFFFLPRPVGVLLACNGDCIKSCCCVACCPMSIVLARRLLENEELLGRLPLIMLPLSFALVLSSARKTSDELLALARPSGLKRSCDGVPPFRSLGRVVRESCPQPISSSRIGVGDKDLVMVPFRALARRRVLLPLLPPDRRMSCADAAAACANM